MMNKDSKKNVFSQPIRKLSAAELDQVVGGGGDAAIRKPAGSADNQGRRT